MIVRIGFPVWLRVLILDPLSEDNEAVVSDRVSRLASRINPGPVVSEVIFTCLGKTKETLIEYR